MIVKMMDLPSIYIVLSLVISYLNSLSIIMGIGLAKTSPASVISFECTNIKWNHLVLNISNRELASIQIRELISSGTTLFEMNVTQCIW